MVFFTAILAGWSYQLLFTFHLSLLGAGRDGSGQSGLADRLQTQTLNPVPEIDISLKNTISCERHYQSKLKNTLQKYIND